jgi:3-hydroxy-9,10-secoandrosta-1,3,5(10)-triene-9,17-dione monooxygenase
MEYGMADSMGEAIDLEGGVPTPDELIRRAVALGPFLKGQAPIHREQRRLTPDTIARLRQAGLFRVLQPRRWGGYEMSPSVFADVLVNLARADPSVGFVYGVLAVHSFHLAFYDDAAARDVWGADTDVLIGSPYMPTGRATPVPGGYRLSGRWSFSSGCDNCDWNFLGGTVEDGAAGDTPLVQRMHAFLVPRADAHIVDTWRVLGLQGTGSKDLVVEDAFVPQHRVQRFPIYDPTAHPGTTVNTGALFRTPFMPLFFRAVSSAAIGALEGMIEAFCAYTDGRRTVMSEQAAQDPMLQMALAQARCGADEMKAILHRNFAETELAGLKGVPLTPERLTLFMLQSANVPHKAEELALKLLRAAGANGIRTDGELAHYYADILVIGQHSSNGPKLPAMGLGKMMLGLP